MMFVDITTQPGMGPMRGSLDFTFRDDALNARNAFVPEKGPEQTQQYTLNLSGTLLKERTSFSLSAGGASLYDSANIFAATPGGPAQRRRAPPVGSRELQRPHRSRADQVAHAARELPAERERAAQPRRRQLRPRRTAPTRARSDDRLLRFSETGPWSTVAVRRDAPAAALDHRPSRRRRSRRRRSGCSTPSPSGGAQQAGGRAAPRSSTPPTSTGRRARHSIRAGHARRGRAGIAATTAPTTSARSRSRASRTTRPAGRRPTRGASAIRSSTYSQWQAGLYVQDDWRARKNLTLSAGVRQEVQTHLDDRWNLAPRAGFTWSPFKSGKTTVRGGAGIFYDWLEAETYEQTLRVDGMRQQDLVVRNPGYPDPFAGGIFQEVLPDEQVPAGRRPRDAAPGDGQRRRQPAADAADGPQRELQPHRRATIGSAAATSTRRVPDGTRPDPAFGNVTQVESTARMRGDTVNVGFNINIPAPAHVPVRELLVDQPEERRRRPVQPAGRQLRPRRASGARRPAFRTTSSAPCSTPACRRTSASA